jgi:DUF1680 family protein
MKAHPNFSAKFLTIGLAFMAFLWPVSSSSAEHAGALIFGTLPSARFDFAGPVGARARANVENWLLPAPLANPGMIEMFRLRDRQPVRDLVPWAGEFVGKYLISAVQALRMSEDPRLRQRVKEVVAELIASQAEDGYLGPFPKNDRLRKNWDLWGHYHVICALMLWHEQTGDAAALGAARKAADLVCATYLDAGRRVLDAGDPEMNMAILTGMAMLHRVTGEPRYLRMAREVEQDWERAGDYLRAGLDGREFFRSPRPRWESLHDLQGLLELWRITGDPKYREAFEHHWRSIRRWDRRNTGGFSSGEQATGNPYAPSAIETCCTVAWMALTLDYLRLTGDPRAADDLELATLNGGLGAQHPSGRWWTYNTPMDGVREASAHSIVFQARAGTPELNCCSVNGPRVLGMLTEWAFMSATNGLVLNWLGSGRFTHTLAYGTRVTITSSDEVWREGRTELTVVTDRAATFPLLLRIPAWAREVKVRLNGEPYPAPAPGRYLALQRLWSGSERLEVTLEVPMRFVSGANEAAGKVSIYRGPVLLAYDQAQNGFDETAIPVVDLARLAASQVVNPPRPNPGNGPAEGPWLIVEVPAVDGAAMRLVDFANAGSFGTRYRSWLAARPAPPAPAVTQLPPDAAHVRPGAVTFKWRGPRTGGPAYRLEFSAEESFSRGVVWKTNVAGTSVTLNTAPMLSLLGDSAARVWWRVVSGTGDGETVPEIPPAWFRFDVNAPPQPLPARITLGPDDELLAHSLRGEAGPEFGQLKSAGFSTRNDQGTEFNGRDQMLVYALPAWPEEDFTVSFRLSLQSFPTNRIGQAFSAWAGVMDDPLRLVVDRGELFARIEAGRGYSTPGATVVPGRWYAVAAVKQAGTLTLYVDGQKAGSCAVPEVCETRSTECALGGNPRYTGNEFLAMKVSDFRLHSRALTPPELQKILGVPER